MTGRKVVVVGTTAAGKTTFSKKLAEKANLPLFLIDSIMWKPGWNYTGEEAIAEKLEEISRGNEWLIEGYIVDPARDTLLERADTILYLDYSPWVASWRYLKRWWKHRKDPRPELPGSPERFSFKFIELAWSRGEIAWLEKMVGKLEYRTKFIRLKSPKQAMSFIESL